MKKILLFIFFSFAASLLSQEQAEPRVCLTMIVKNESKIIERCLSSVEKLVDFICICDTGSTDNTVAIIEKFIKEHNIPGKVYNHAWKNFGHNRSFSIQAAKQLLSDLDVPLEQTYLLLLDADMLLETAPNFSTQQLKADSYLVMQKFGFFEYYNTRLIRASLPWISKGVTHEYWHCDVPQHQEKLLTLSIDDREDGGCKADKFERDIKLLTQGIQDEPNNERYLFYLAQSYKCLGKFDEAIRWYKMRIDKGGWPEEVWYSKMMIGTCYEDQDRWEEALHWYLEAYQSYPRRAEPLKKVSGHYRNIGNHELAVLFAKQGASIPYPKDDLLFISRSVYEYEFDEDLSISAYYTPAKEMGFAALNRLLLKKEVPEDIREQAKRNLLFYVPILENTVLKPIALDLPSLEKDSDEHYCAMNSSIKKTDQGYALICRTVNYKQRGGLEYKVRSKLANHIQTRNFLVAMDKNFHIESQREIIDGSKREKFPSQVQGLEDCRWINEKEGRFICTTLDFPPGIPVQALCQLDHSSQSMHEPIAVKTVIPLKGPNPGRCEKNWLPVQFGKKMAAIYSYDPLVILAIAEDGNCQEVLRETQNYDFSNFRGSAGPIPFENGYLALIHEVIFSDQRYYVHRFLYLDKDFKIKKVSHPFVFSHKGIEYCCGMTLTHDATDCILTISIEDCEAFLCILPIDAIAKTWLHL